MKATWLYFVAFCAAALAVRADDLPIVAWNEWGIPLKEISVARYREAREAGFTHLVQRFYGSPQETVERVVRALDCAEGAGLKLFVRCDLLSNSPETLVPVIRNHPALAMYCVKDEPRSSEFAKVGEVMRRIKAMDPYHPCYVNWFGILCMPDGSWHWSDLEDFPEFARQAKAVMPLELVSFDSYPIIETNGTCVIKPKWFGKLEFMRKFSTDENLPYWGFALSTAHWNGPRNNYPIPTAAHLKLQQYANLAHGAQGLQYFTYWTPRYDTNACFRLGPISWEGKRTFMYDRVREVNAELQARADVFLGARVVDLGHTGELPIGTKRLDSLPKFVHSFDCRERPAILSYLKNGRRDIFMVVNRDLDREFAFAAGFAAGTRQVRKDGTRGEVPAKSTFRIEPGGAAIFEWAEGGAEPPAMPEERPDALAVGDIGMSAASVFDSSEMRLRRIGTLRPRNAHDIRAGRTAVGFEQLDRRMFEPERTYDLVAAAGIKHARCQTGWCRCERSRGVFDFAWLADVVTNLVARGVSPWFNVGFGNTNYMESCHSPAAVGNVPLYYGEECRKAWLRYVRTLADRYRGQVSHWEIWNEPNNDHFWQPRKPDAEAYCDLIRMTAAEIRKAVPDAKIGASIGGVYDWDHADVKYTQEFLSAGGAKLIDFWCVHAYGRMPERCGRNLALVRADRYDLLRKAFAAAGGRDVVLWQGEGGYPSWLPKSHWLYDGAAPGGVTSQANQAKWILRRFVMDFASGIELSSIFQMVDIVHPYSMGRSTQKWAARHGLLDGFTYRRKMSWWAMAHWNALMSGTEFASGGVGVDTGTERPTLAYSYEDATTPDPQMQPWGGVFKGSDGVRIVYCKPVSFDSDYQGSLSASVSVSAADAPSDPVLVDLLRGGIYSVSPPKANAGRVTFSNLPLVDYPLVLCSKSLALPRCLR